ncbi:hypothetical protein BP422_29235 [Brevibacillus formosus]|uniref:Uncharacterized protein n=1 Tax=Brevibacillus formosus TaxID=54913 RepID=A0A220MQM2_9BACL|nr:hypothetical protein [Brevibacillus formosus]ASJ57233.1 hypothetical protein BP422_29235 [Brevibacillus formosus]
MNIRRGKGLEASELSELAYRSKAYWGHSDEFMEACRDDLTLSPASIERRKASRRNRVYRVHRQKIAVVGSEDRKGS